MFSWKPVQEFCAENFKLILAIVGINMLGGIIALIFDPIFAIIFPLWLAFVAYVMKKGYKE